MINGTNRGLFLWSGGTFLSLISICYGGRPPRSSPHITPAGQPRSLRCPPPDATSEPGQGPTGNTSNLLFAILIPWLLLLSHSCISFSLSFYFNTIFSSPSTFLSLLHISKPCWGIIFSGLRCCTMKIFQWRVCVCVMLLCLGGLFFSEFDSYLDQDCFFFSFFFFVAICFRRWVLSELFYIYVCGVYF